VSNTQHKTDFRVDEERCNGCGECVDACPMQILVVEDLISEITVVERCLECGTCMRACPNEAISISVAAGKGPSSRVGQAPERVGDGEERFTPILAALEKRLEAVSPVQQFTLNGLDIHSLNSFDVDGHACFYRLFTAEKLEKIGVSRMNFYGMMAADVMVIKPGPEYDLPYYIVDWDESDEHIFFICDLLPSDDIGRNSEHLERYFYGPLEDLYQEYATIPGIAPSQFHWVRALHSPYLLTGNIDKSSQANVDRLLAVALKYFDAWLALYRAAEPRNPDSEEMRLVQARRRNIRQLYSANDPGVAALHKFLDEKMAQAALDIIEP